MEVNLNVLWVLIILTTMLTGCKKDSKDEARNNAANFEGKEYALSKGYLEYYGKVYAKESYNMDITIISSGITVLESNGQIDSIYGVGNVLYFEIFTSDSILDSRTYTFDPQETYEPGTFDDGIVGLNLDAATFEGIFFPVVSGTVKVNKSGDAYEVTVNCKNGDGKTITVYFKGPLKYYDYAMDLKRSQTLPSFFKRLF
jgi:hypothetical protein